MPLIALDILEQKIKELVLIVNRLKEENASLRHELESGRSASAGTASASVPTEIQEEIKLLQEQVAKYRTERSVLYSKLASAMKNLDIITSGGGNG